MIEKRNSDPAFVIKADELTTLYFLDVSHPRPCAVEWINRSTDQTLRPTTVDMLLRTLHSDTDRPSVKSLRDTSGLRVRFLTAKEQERFARAFKAARETEYNKRPHIAGALFDHWADADAAAVDLKDAGVPETALSMVWRTSTILDPAYTYVEGHSAPSVAGIMAGAGMGGALLGVAVLLIPGIGGVAAAGAILASAGPSVAAVSGVIGATGGAIAKMLTDHDVDGPSVAFFQTEIQRGKAFLSIDTEKTTIDRERLERTVRSRCGKLAAPV